MFRRTWLLGYKQAVAGNLSAENPAEQRFWGILGASYCSQLTSYNTGSSFEDAPVVESVLAGCGVLEDEASNRELVFVVPRNSKSETNLKTGGMCSLMYGSTNPQIHHFFKQLNVKCWTSTVTGRGERLEDAREGRAWADLFIQNPYLMQQAVPSNAVRVPRKKHDTVADEDEEDDTVKANRLESFSLWKIHPENGFLGRPPGGMDKVSVLVIPPLDPLREVVQKWITRFNFRRDILVEGVKTAYSIPLKYCFCFHLDSHGLYLMGCTEDDPTWQEFFLEWGPNMVYDQPSQIQSWWQEFVAQTNISYDDVFSAKPDDLVR